MTGKFEAHITVDRQYAKAVETIGGELGGWVYSQISGCPILGQGTYCYLSAFGTNDIILLARVTVAEQQLQRHGVPVLRSKIERIVYDTKTNVNEVRVQL